MHSAVCIIIKVFFKICRHIGEVPVINLIIRIKKILFYKYFRITVTIQG